MDMPEGWKRVNHICYEESEGRAIQDINNMRRLIKDLAYALERVLVEARTEHQLTIGTITQVDHALNNFREWR